MLPSMASSSLAFMSLDFLKVKLFILSNAFFPCMVNTTWALYPRGRGRNDKEHSGKVIYITALSQKIQVSRGERNGSPKRKLTALHVCVTHARIKARLWKAGSCWYFISTFNSQSISAQKLLSLTAPVDSRNGGSTLYSKQETQRKRRSSRRFNCDTDKSVNHFCNTISSAFFSTHSRQMRRLRLDSAVKLPC